MKKGESGRKNLPLFYVRKKENEMLEENNKFTVI